MCLVYLFVKLCVNVCLSHPEKFLLDLQNFMLYLLHAHMHMLMNCHSPENDQALCIWGCHLKLHKRERSEL